MQCNRMAFMGQERWFLIVSFLCTRTSWPTGSHGFGCVSGPILLIAVICSTNGPSLERLVEHLALNHSHRPSGLCSTGWKCNNYFHAVVFLWWELNSVRRLMLFWRHAWAVGVLKLASLDFFAARESTSTLCSAVWRSHQKKTPNCWATVVTTKLWCKWTRVSVIDILSSTRSRALFLATVH